MELKNLSSKPLIIFLLVGISVAAIVLSVFASFQAKQAAMDAQAKTLARVIEVASDEVLEELFTKTKEVAHLIQKVKNVRQLIKAAKSTPLKPSQLNQLGEDLSLQFKQLYVTAGIIDLVKVRAYNKKFDYIVASHAGEKGFSDNLPTAIKEQISNREKGDRYKPFNTLWKNQEKTYYSLFYPVGGLSLSGYIEVVIAPSHNLKIIDNVLGAPLTIHSIDNTLLYQSENWQAKSESLLEIHYPLRFQNGEIALNLFLQEDVTEFLQSVKQTQMLIIGLFVLLGIVAVALAIFLLEGNLFRPMKALQDSMSSVSEGDYSIEIKGSNRKDELGGMTNALLYFIFVFKENQKISTEASRIKFALQNAAAAMMIVDANEEIIFVNNSISQLFSQHQSDLSKLSSGSCDDLVGLVFSKHFDQLKELSLSEIQEPTYKEVRAGERYLKLAVSPVNSENAERVGTTIEWQDLTDFYQKKAQEEERRIEEKNKLAREQKLFRENSRIRQALDGVERGVAIVDVHGNLAYNNRSMAKMIKPINNASLTIHQPFDLLGLANEEQLQKQIQQGFEEKEIKIGNHVFLVHATPVHDDSDQQIGSAIEWSDKTEEAEVETEIDNLIMKASQGELNKRISLENKRGFFLAVGKKLNDLVELINRSLTDTKLMMDSLANGNLNHRIKANYQGTFGEIASSANQTAENLNDMIKNIQEMSSSVYTSSQEIAKGNMDLSSRTEKQGTILADTLTSMDSISENSIKCDEEAKSATVYIDQARSITDEAGVVSKRAVIAMNNITESSQKVMSITEMINDIAFQTNLLSLNAAVEAARAGEQGKGFAVVANEVRLLAQRSASASSEIKSLLDEANELVSNGTKEVSSSGEMLIGIANVTGQISGGMNSINDSTEQQRKGINNISHSVDEMKKMTQQNAAMVEEIAATSESMLEHAQGMQKAAGFFKLKK